MMPRKPRIWTGLYIAFMTGWVLSSCGPQIGVDERDLLGRWTQEEASQINPTLRIDDVIVSYERDGMSTFQGIMSVGVPNADPGGGLARFSVVADVGWTLDETVLVRTLRKVVLTPQELSPETEALARTIEAVYAATPAGRLIVERLDESHLVVLDADTGETQTYRRLD